jgi:hypothetical protein
MMELSEFRPRRGGGFIQVETGDEILPLNGVDDRLRKKIDRARWRNYQRVNE